MGVSTLLRKKFFQFFDGKVQGFGNSLMACPFQPADLPDTVGQMEWVMLVANFLIFFAEVAFVLMASVWARTT